MMPDRDEHLLDLLATRATEGLDPFAQADLDQFCQAQARGISGFEREAAAVALVYASGDEPMPTQVRGRVAARLQAEIAGASDQAPRDARRDTANTHSTPASPNVTVGSFGSPTATSPADATPDQSRSPWLPWLAAAAALALAVLGWWPRVGDLDVGPGGLPPSIADLRAQMIAATTDSLQIDWTATEDPVASDARGDVVWNNQRQRGFMRFAGLAPNDPSESQYQLWIFDAAQDERFPVDGGVFDVGPDGETVIAIDPKIQIVDPTLFAVTVEKPGGVVVSSRERIVLVAAIG